MRPRTFVLLLGVIAAAVFGARQTGMLDSIWPHSANFPFQSGTSTAKTAGGDGAPVVMAQYQSPASPAAAADPANAPPKVDETALRYFASKGDTKRLEAEIARLKALYPQWTPPANPLVVQQNGDPQLDRMWKLYSDGKLAEVRKAIADRQVAEPTWKVPADLLDRLAVAEARDKLVNASNLKQFETVVRVGAETPTLLTCGDVDVLWRLAEAFAKTDRAGRAKDVYLYILNNCAKPEERLATVQKALPLLPRADLDALLATEKTGADGVGEFASIRGDLARKSVSEGGTDPTLVVPAADLAAVQKLAKDGGLASDALLLGWYYVRRDNAEEAEKWFRSARDKENTAESSQGLALALIELSKFAEAESILYQWRTASDEVRAVYHAATANLLAVEPPLPVEPRILQRIVAEVAATKDVATAQQLGWYSRAFNQFQTAAQWFETALRWKPDDEPSAYGLAVTRFQLGDMAGLKQIQAAWQGRSERIAAVGTPGAKDLGEAPISMQVAPLEKTAALPQPISAPLPSNLDVRMAAAPLAQPAPVREVPLSQPVPVRAPEPNATTRAVEATEPRQQPSRSAPPASAQPRQAGPRGCSTPVPPESFSGQAALDRGWCLMELNRPLEAAAVFEVALQSTSPKVRQDAAYGQSLAYLRVGLPDKAAVSAAKAPQDSQRANELDVALLSDRAIGAFDAGRFNETLMALDQRAQLAPERNDLMALRGYAYLRLGRFGEARRVFEAIAATGSSDGPRGLADLHDVLRPRAN